MILTLSIIAIFIWIAIEIKNATEYPDDYEDF